MGQRRLWEVLPLVAPTARMTVRLGGVSFLLGPSWCGAPPTRLIVQICSLAGSCDQHLTVCWRLWDGRMPSILMVVVLVHIGHSGQCQVGCFSVTLQSGRRQVCGQGRGLFDLMLDVPSKRQYSNLGWYKWKHLTGGWALGWPWSRICTNSGRQHTSPGFHVGHGLCCSTCGHTSRLGSRGCKHRSCSSRLSRCWTTARNRSPQWMSWMRTVWDWANSRSSRRCASAILLPMERLLSLRYWSKIWALCATKMATCFLWNHVYTCDVGLDSVPLLLRTILRYPEMLDSKAALNGVSPIQVFSSVFPYLPRINVPSTCWDSQMHSKVTCNYFGATWKRVLKTRVFSSTVTWTKPVSRPHFDLRFQKYERKTSNPPALPACLVEWGLMMDCLSVLCCFACIA